MKEFTERHHAFIAASFYALLVERFEKRGEAAFVHATQRYAEQRGARMAQRAIRDGRELNFLTYREYGEWVNTQTVKDMGCDNQGYVVSYAPDFDERVTMCPWAAQFKDMDMAKAGTVYCTHLDSSVVRGFNPRCPRACTSMNTVSRSPGAPTLKRERSPKSARSTCTPSTITAGICIRRSRAS